MATTRSTAQSTFVQTAAVEVPLTLRVEPSLLRVRDSAAGQLDITDRQPARAPGPAGCSSAAATRNGSSGSPSHRRRSTCFAGELGRARARVEAPPAGRRAGSQQDPDACSPSAGAPPTSRQPRPSCRRPSAAPVDTPVVAAARPQRGAGQGHRRRAARAADRQPRRPPGAAGLPDRSGPGTAGQVHLLAAVARCPARRHRPVPGPAGGRAARARSGGHPAGDGRGRGRRPGARGQRHVRPDHLGGAGRDTGGAETGAEPGPGAGRHRPGNSR